MKKLGLYLHIPFCVQKCKYCDFLSAPTNLETMVAYTNALCNEIKQKAGEYHQYVVDTIFIGGGTPSILPEQQMKQICDTIQKNFQLDSNIEWSIECNPGTVTKDKLKTYHESGINRLSFGLQSCNNDELKLLGRIHSYEDFLHSYHLARNAGFNNVNIDLMSALPGQEKESFKDTIRKVIALKPEHISAYSLIIEEGTPFYSMYGETELDEDLDREIYRMTEQELDKAGYEHYEISNYAKPGYQSRHNTKYWKREAYLGLGLGASSMVEDIRWHNETKLSAYLDMTKEDNRFELDTLTRQDCMEEFMFLGLRMMEGVSQKRFAEIFGETLLHRYESVIQKHLEEGLLMQSQDGDRYFLTERGIDVSNYVMSEYMD